jgi:hypothetical protein
MRAHFEMCYMITKFTKKNVKGNGKTNKNRKINTVHVFLYVENLAKRRKYPVRISAYMI